MGHWAHFQIKTFDLKSDLGIDKTEQIFGTGSVEKFVPKFVRGKNKGKFKGCLVIKTCTYGGAYTSSRQMGFTGGIARPGDEPLIMVVAKPAWEIEQWGEEEMKNESVLVSDKWGNFGYPKDGEAIHLFENPSSGESK